MTATRERIVAINETYAQLEELSLRVRYYALYGGRRSGKSVSISQLLIKRALSHKRKIVCMRKFAVTIRHSVWARMLVAVDETIGRQLCKINKSDREIELPNGSTAYFVGADDPDKLKSIEGVTDFWLEEANEFDELDLDTLDAGLSPQLLSGEPVASIWVSFNPIPIIEGRPHWLQSRFVNRVPHELSIPAILDNICVLRTWYKDNAFCPPETIKLLESYKDTNPQLYEMWGKGNFTHLEGVIITNWDTVFDVPKTVDFWGYGLDFGFADDPAAVVGVWGSHTEIWLRQIVYSTGLTNPELSAELEARGVRKRNDLIVADAAEPKSIKELCDRGWMVIAGDKGPDYKRALALRLREYAIHVTVDSPDIQTELSTWSWMRDRKSNRPLPKPQDGNDHSIDALICVISKRARFAKPALPKSESRAPKPLTAGLKGSKF